MAKVGINTGSAANAGDGSALRAGANIVNANFDEIYEYFGDGTTLDADLAGKWLAVSTGINTLSNIGIGTTNPWNALTVLGNASITGVTTSSGGFSGDITGSLTGDVYNTGISTFQDVLVSGASTITGKSTFTGIGTFSSDLYVGGNLYTLGDITYDEVNGRNISVTGIGTVAYLGVTDLNVSGFSTFSGLSTTGSDLYIGDSLYVSQDATVTGVVTARGGVVLPDTTSLYLGNDDDLELLHTAGGGSYIKNNTLALDIRGDTTNINSKNNSVTFLKANASGLMATTGILSATTFSGAATGLTGVPGGQITGTLAAVDGSALTGMANTAYVNTASLNVSGVSTFAGEANFNAGINVGGGLTVTGAGSTAILGTTQGTVTVGVGTISPLSQLQVNTTKNVGVNTHDRTNYALGLRNPEDDDGEKIGLSFAITSNETKVGAAILHQRDAGGSQGGLEFWTSGDGASITERVTIPASGGLTVTGAGSTSTFEGDVKMTGNNNFFNPPSLTTTERNNATTMTAGSMIWNETANRLEYYNGSAWRKISNSAV